MKFTDVENSPSFSSAVEARICIIMLKASPNPEAELQELGAYSYDVRPIDTEGLLKQIVGALDRWTS